MHLLGYYSSPCGTWLHLSIYVLSGSSGYQLISFWAEIWKREISRTNYNLITAVFLVISTGTYFLPFLLSILNSSHPQLSSSHCGGLSNDITHASFTGFPTLPLFFLPFLPSFFPPSLFSLFFLWFVHSFFLSFLPSFLLSWPFKGNQSHGNDNS